MARPRGSPVRVDRALIERQALKYLDRFDASAVRLRAHLMRALRRHTADDAELDAARALVDEVVGRYEGCGILDDARFAASLARSLRARGSSLRVIRQKLATRGVSAEVTRRVLAGVAEDIPEEQAAREWARRRRIGPWRAGGEQQGAARRDFAALARAGFDPDVARRVLELAAGDDD